MIIIQTTTLDEEAGPSTVEDGANVGRAKENIVNELEQKVAKSEGVFKKPVDKVHSNTIFSFQFDYGLLLGHQTLLALLFFFVF